MPPVMLLAFVVVGIGGIVLLLHLTGRSREKVMTAQAAHAEWDRQFPGDEVLEALPSNDGHAALIVARQGIGLVWAMGAGGTARRLLDFDLIEEPDGLTVRFHDFTAPHVTLHLDDFERRRRRNLMDPT